MKKYVGVVFFVVAVFSGYAQDQMLTTFILVRHAEKDLTQSTSDPDLSEEGKQRASRLVTMLQSTDVEVIYSTDFKRTKQTVEPVATARSLPVNTYDSRKTEEIDTMLYKHAGKTILVSGHSNTIPQFVNYLIGAEKYKPMGDGEYGNIIVVTVSERGKSANVVWLRY